MRLSDEKLRAIYDQRYVDIYDPHAVQRMRRMLPFFALSGDATVADFGCGNGVLLELIGPRVREYVGVDFSEPFARAAERRRDAHGITNGRFECADIAAFANSIRTSSTSRSRSTSPSISTMTSSCAAFGPSTAR